MSISAITAISAIANNDNLFTFVKADNNTVWKHYAAIEASENTYGSKEFWASCSEIGHHVFNEPTSGAIIEGGDFSLTPYFSLLTLKDDRFVPSFAKQRELGMIPVVDANNITYGLYPQHVVSEGEEVDLLTALNALDDSDIGINGWYVYNEKYYTKLTATPYDKGTHFDDEETIEGNHTYWFKCEAISWKILSFDENEYLLLTNDLLDINYYDDHKSNRSIDDKTVAPSNYFYSLVRSYLNNEFYNTAFALDDDNVLEVTVDNSASTTRSNSNPYASDNSLDKVFLPSYRDYINSSYGFSDDPLASSTRGARTSEFARAKGAKYQKSGTYKNNGHYWTRSPHYQDYTACELVDVDGYITNSTVYYADRSIRPAITLEIA